MHFLKRFSFVTYVCYIVHGRVWKITMATTDSLPSWGMPPKSSKSNKDDYGGRDLAYWTNVNGVDENYDGSISTKITLPTNAYKTL